MYFFEVGQRVRYAYWWRTGEVIATMPGKGSLEWYFVRWEDGLEERYTRNDLESI